MRTRSIALSLLMASAFLLFNCGEKKDGASKEEQAAEEHASGSTASAEAAAPTYTVDAEFQKQLADVFNAYVAMKDAFVASDAATVKTSATTTKGALQKIKMQALSGVAHNDGMTWFTNIETELTKIEATADIEAQRESFSAVSDNLYKAIKAFGLGGVTAYYDFCPMAFNNTGGYWLSGDEKIRNPYFGDKMLTCGSVKEMMR